MSNPKAASTEVMLARVKEDPQSSVVETEAVEIAVAHTYEAQNKGAKVIKALEKFLTDNYEVRYNTIKGFVEWLNPETNQFEPIVDYVENSILRKIRLEGGVDCDQSLLRATLLSEYCPKFNPFLAYFEWLPVWDGQTDHIGDLGATVMTTNPELWIICLRKWLVAYVACGLDDKIVNQTVIVFSGKQGAGKTTWMEMLVPPALKAHLFSGTINPNNKDTLVQLSECLLINLDELENLNKTEVGSLKELITKTQIVIRRPYGRNNEVLPRRASFVGSVNSAQFLNDTTGSRRFLCFDVDNISIPNVELIEKALAQAYQLFKTGFKHWFDSKEIAQINANNEQYQVCSVEEEMVRTYFEPANPQFAQLYLNATQIIQRLIDKGVNQPMRVISMGKVLKKLGYERLKKGLVYVYAINEHTAADIEANTVNPSVITKTGIVGSLKFHKN